MSSDADDRLADDPESIPQVLGDHYRYAVERDLQTAWTAQPDGQLDHVNDRWFLWTGTTGLGESWANGLHIDDRERTFAVWGRCVATGEPYDVEHRAKMVDGSYRWMHSTAHARRDAEGRIVKWYGRTEDIHDRRLAGEQLRASEARFAAAISAVGVLWTNDASGQMVGQQPGWMSLTGQSSSEYEGYGWAAAVHPDDAQPTLDAWTLAVSERRPFVFEHRIRTRGGGYAHFAVRAVPVFDEQANILEWVGVHRDISDQRLAEQALRDLNDDLERQVAERTAERDRAWDQSLDLQLVISPDGTIIAANRAWTRNLGWEKEEIVGQHHFIFHFPEDYEANASALTAAAKDPLAGHETRMRHKDGTPRWVNWVANPQGDRIYANGRDVTERHAAEEKLRQAQKMEAIGQLTGGVAHDFNNLLTVISGGLQMLNRSNNADRTQRLMSGMRQAVERGAALTRQLLAFSRRQALRPEPIALAPMVDGMRDLLDRSLRGDIRVETDFPDALWPVEADPGELQLALINLCVNARDAMPSGGVIRITAGNLAATATRPGDAVELRVVDEGLGMSPEVIPRVFEPFFTTKDVGHGSGLGLAQVHGFATQSGGSVAVESVLGAGTTISLALPRSTRVPDQPECEGSKAGARQGTGRVLLVEDDPQVALLVTDMIGELGYQVEHISDGASALERLSGHHQVDVVLSDVMMPGGVSGIDLVRCCASVEFPSRSSSRRAVRTRSRKRLRRAGLNCSPNPSPSRRSREHLRAHGVEGNGSESCYK